jgi:Icc-related predicted phosphoesterase
MSKNKRFKKVDRFFKAIRIVFIGDMHVGSIYSVASPFVTLTSNDAPTTLETTKKQHALFEVFSECAKKFSQPDLLMVVGEPIDGPNPKSPQDAWTLNTTDQINEAEKLVKMFGAKKIKMVRGSGYHGSNMRGQNAEMTFAEQVGVSPNSDGELVPAEHLLNVNGTRILVAHHQPNYTVYRATGLNKQVKNMYVNAGVRETKPYNCMVFGHVHFYDCVDIYKCKVISLPSWKLNDWFSKKTGIGDDSSIGAVQLTIQPNGKMTVEALIYDLPHEREPEEEVVS